LKEATEKHRKDAGKHRKRNLTTEKSGEGQRKAEVF
jgi:hypothetical protein